MDYKKKLKDALDDKLVPVEVQEWIEENFPELVDDEDERIRKGIIRNLEYLMDRAEGFVKDELKERIAWLEKQGEQKPADKVEPKFKVKYAGSEYNVLEVKDIAGVTFYGIEDEPNHIDYVLSDHCEIVRGHSYGMKEKSSSYPTKSAIFSEQKPAWSEEDAEILQQVIADIEDLIAAESGIKFLADYHKHLNWLNSLKDRVLLQPKQEWSEDDEELLNDISDTYFYDDSDYPEEIYKRMLKKVLDWMNTRAKFLRPNHWKPSEEQMKALDIALKAGIQLGTWEEKALRELKEQIEKL